MTGLANIPKVSYEHPLPKGALGPGGSMNNIIFSEVVSVEMIDGWWNIESINANGEHLTSWYEASANEPLRITHTKDPTE